MTLIPQQGHAVLKEKDLGHTLHVLRLELYNKWTRQKERMKQMEERLPDTFMRIHRSYIVNLTKIQEVNKNRIIMDANTYLPIGDLYKEAFQAYLNTKFLGK